MQTVFGENIFHGVVIRRRCKKMCSSRCVCVGVCARVHVCARVCAALLLSLAFECDDIIYMYIKALVSNHVPQCFSINICMSRCRVGEKIALTKVCSSFYRIYQRYARR